MFEVDDTRQHFLKGPRKQNQLFEIRFTDIPPTLAHTLEYSRY